MNSLSLSEAIICMMESHIVMDTLPETLMPSPCSTGKVDPFVYSDTDEDEEKLLETTCNPAGNE